MQSYHISATHNSFVKRTYITYDCTKYYLMETLCGNSNHNKVIIKGAKVTRSTSAYALPLFLPRPENSKQKSPVQGKNNPKIHFPAPF